MAYSARKVELLIKTGTFSSSKRKGIRKGKTDCNMYRGVGAYQSVGSAKLETGLSTADSVENGKWKIELRIPEGKLPKCRGPTA